MRRRHFVLLPIIAVIMSSAAMPFVASAHPQSEDLHLTILHTNDTHGHLLPYSYPEQSDPKSPEARLPVRHDIGGIARRATLVNRIRAEKDHSTLLIDAGDICDGTPFSTEYHGSADIDAMNAIGYDIACPGNHEYNNTLQQVRTMASAAHFALISANTTVKADGKLLYSPYIIKTIAGVRIAFFGLLTFDARTYPAAKTELEMQMPIDAARKLVPELRKQADLVIAVTHIGVDEDVKLAAEVPGIDLIVGGHSHTLLAKPIVVPHPDDTQDHSVRGTLIVQDFQWAGTLGRLDLSIHHDAGHAATISAFNGRLLPITGALATDPTVAVVVDKYWKPIAAKYGKVLGETVDDITSVGDDLCEYNLVADSVREQTGADFVMENLGGVRAPLTRGPVTYGDLISMDPFGNKIVTFRATGKQVKQMLASVRPAVSGIVYSLNNGTLTSATIGGKPIDDTASYTGATNSYLAQTLLKNNSTAMDTGKDRLQATIAYVQKHSPLHAVKDGRRKIIGSSSHD